jgi:uncharacterized protein YdbL (DUF1318 family)
METTFRQSLTLLFACSTLGGCKAPTVNLATSEPIKVDINMRLDVYQYSSPSAKKPAQGQAPSTAQTPEARRRNRMADIQQFKNERLVGEGHEGLLVIRSKPEGEYGDYVRVAVEEENADRMDLMKSLAESQKTSLPEIQGKQAELWRNRSFKGEWIETPGPDGSWNWVQKEG